MTAFFCRDLFESTSSTCFTLLLRARQNVSATASFQLQSIRMQFHYLWFPVWSKKQLHRALAKHAGEENMYFTSIKRRQRILNIAILQKKWKWHESEETTKSAHGTQDSLSTEVWKCVNEIDRRTTSVRINMATNCCKQLCEQKHMEHYLETKTEQSNKGFGNDYWLLFLFTCYVFAPALQLLFGGSKSSAHARPSLDAENLHGEVGYISFQMSKYTVIISWEYQLTISIMIVSWSK